MRADTSYNDFRGSAAADISDGLGFKTGDELKSIGKFFKLNEDRFKIIGLSIYGTYGFSISLICIDKEKSTNEKEHIVTMRYDVYDIDEREILDILFKRLHIVLHDKYDDKYVNLEYNEEVRYSDFHEIPEEKKEE